jgi:hypothetical protein
VKREERNNNLPHIELFNNHYDIGTKVFFFFGAAKSINLCRIKGTEREILLFYPTSQWCALYMDHGSRTKVTFCLCLADQFTI